MEEDWPRRSYPGLAMGLSHRDTAHLIERSIDAPQSAGYLIVYGMSGNSLRIHEIETAHSVLGYHPQDDAGERLDSQAGPDVPYYRRAHP